MAIGLPLGRSFQSISVGILLGALVFDILYRGDWKSRGRKIIQHRITQGAFLFFLPMLISLSWTEDTQAGIRLLKTFLPLVLVAPVISGMPSPRARAVNMLLGLHLAALALCTLIGLANYLSLELDQGNSRDWIPFINHIRLSLILLMGVIIGFHRFVSKDDWSRWLFLILSIWFIGFMVLAEMMTGLAIGFILLSAWTIHSLFSRAAKSRALVLVSVVAILSCGVFLTSKYSNYFTYLDPELIDMEARTAQGNTYWHESENQLIQDGHYVWRYICREELSEAWSSRSQMPLEGIGQNGSRLEWGLIRYLTSKGVRKDTEAVMALSQEEVVAIEKGAVSVNQHNGGLNRRLDQLFFEWDAYRNGGNPSSNSLTRRIEYWRASLLAIKGNPWLGSGIGDAQSVLNVEFESIGTLDRSAWHKSHQQYLSILLMLGIPLGIIAFLGILRAMGFFISRNAWPIFTLAMTTLLLSFLTENTLETQTGMSFFLFYLALAVSPKVHTEVE